jgi:hypothetical protein
MPTRHRSGPNLNIESFEQRRNGDVLAAQSPFGHTLFIW